MTVYITECRLLIMLLQLWIYVFIVTYLRRWKMFSYVSSLSGFDNFMNVCTLKSGFTSPLCFFPQWCMCRSVLIIFLKQKLLLCGWVYMILLFFVVLFGAGPWNLAIWMPLSIIFCGYTHCINISFSSESRYSITSESDTKTIILFAKQYGMFLSGCFGWK